MKKIIMMVLLLLTVGTLAFTGCTLISRDSDSKYEKDKEEKEEEDNKEDEEDTEKEKEDESQQDNKDESNVESETIVEPYGFTAYFDPQKEPGDTVDSFSSTDTLYYVVIGNNFPAGSSIHQVWEYLEDGSIIEGDLVIPVDIERNYLGFNLTPDGELPLGRYQVTLTWTIDGVDGELVSDIVEVK